MCSCFAQERRRLSLGHPPPEGPCLVVPSHQLCLHRSVTSLALWVWRPYSLWKSAAFIQNVILFLLGIPTQIAAVQQPSGLSTSDYILATLALVDIATEFVADNQQYSFQTYKRLGVHEKNEWPGARIKWTPADAKRGFVTRGLWAWSRHPNFFCEQSFWVRTECTALASLLTAVHMQQVIINLFPLLAPESPRLAPSSLQSITPIWPLIPSIVLCLLFFSSTRFTESISISKYPEGYRAYQSRVAMFAPFLTPVWGLLLQLQGKKEKVDRLVYGQDIAEEQKKIQ